MTIFSAIRLALALGFLLALPAAAQVHKCVDGAGKSTYSDTACPTSATRADQVLGRDATEPRDDPWARERNMQSIQRAGEIQRSTVDSVTRQSQGPSGVAVMSRQAPPPVSREASQDFEGCETHSNRKGCIGGERERNPNWSPQRGYYGGGGPADQRYAEEQRAAAAQAKANRPTSFHGCDRQGCYGDKGGRFNFGAGGNLHGANGMVCVRAGNTFSCN